MLFEEEEGNALSSITSLFSLSENSTARMKQLLNAYMVWSIAGKMAQSVKKNIAARRTFTVAVHGDDFIYPELQKWLIGQFKPKARKAIIARAYRDYTANNRQHVGGHLKFFTDSKRIHNIKVNGHKIMVYIEHPDNMRNASHGDYDDLPIFLTAKERMIFTATSTEGREEVIKLLAELASKVAVSRPHLMIPSTYNEWQSNDEIPARSLDTVILRGNQKEDIVQDLRSFLDLELDYARLGIPYHRGYLFHGPPGTGKTSIAKALAFHFNLSVYYIPLPTIENDAKLLKLLSVVPPKSVLLLEDIDIVHGARERDDKEKGVTLSGLLNTLDGFITPHGLITIMTTNDMGVLDKGLIRPGRVDRIEEISYVDDDQLNRLVKMMLGYEIDLPEVSHEVTPAEVIEIAKRNIRNISESESGIIELIKNGH